LRIEELRQCQRDKEGTAPTANVTVTLLFTTIVLPVTRALAEWVLALTRRLRTPLPRAIAP
jgi:hypothetical protein